MSSLHREVDRTPIRGREHQLISELKATWEDYQKSLRQEAITSAKYYAVKAEYALRAKASGESVSYTNNRIKGDKEVNAALLAKLLAAADREALAEKIRIIKYELKALGLEI